MKTIRNTNVILNLPYTSLRAFEVVVRSTTFSAAAEELGVSQSAVSQHVKALEEWLGQELMTRGARRSVPTKTGVQLARVIAEGLGRISDMCEEIRDKRRSDNSIVISCLPGFAFTWLFPRLLRFDLAHPELSISITTDTGQSAFSRSDSDIGIRYGRGENPGFYVVELMEELVFPVCAPSLIGGALPLRSIGDLRHHTLLRDELANLGGDAPSWEFWARENNFSMPLPARSRSFGQSNMVIQAAIEGVGVALGREPLVIDALIDGRLVRPFAETALSQLKYWLVCSHGMRASSKIQLFIDWISAEVKNQPTLPKARLR